ncbi:MAG TPA: hypothetical protein VKU77_39260 [Streptosporangiaceae bacterium]|nr:hypothetical protein [Streptosporangiaceae bacterium]
MTETQISTDWAWISKDPAEGIGYGVLRTSAASVDFRPFIGRYVSGSPSSTTAPDAPDAPPWVTFGPDASGPDGILMSVSVQDRWQERDHVGRPVWPQRLFVMRFADLAAARASYQTMWAAVRDVQVSGQDPAPLPITVSGQVPGMLAATIERYGLAQLGAVAAALLDDPVAVSDAATLPRDERLRVLDAIAALLPYGFRADLSVSSVVDNTVKHEIRLAFADYPRAGQQLLSLRTPAPPLRSQLARRYLAILTEKADTRGLQAVLDHLWTFRRPYSFARPGIALPKLSELDFYGGFSRALHAGRASREEVLKFFADPVQAREYWADFDPRLREEAISPYLADRDDTVMGAVLYSWDFTGNDVAKVVNHHLDAGGAGFGLWCLAAARGLPADRRGPDFADTVADQLLGKMLIPVGLLAKDRSRRIATLVQLLGQCPVPGPGEFRYTCDELRFGDLRGWQAHLVRELLAREAAGAGAGPADRAGPWVRWLCASPFSASWERPSWIAALDFMLSPAADLAAVSVRSVIRQDAAWAAVLVQLASGFRCFNRLLETAERDLIELAAPPAAVQPGSPGAALRGELDRNLWALHVRPATVAAVDVVLVLLGGTPRNLAGELTEAELDGYGDGLGPALDLIAPQRAAVEEAFLGHVISGEPSARLDNAGIWLLNTWATDPDRVTGLGDFIAAQKPAARPYDENLSDAYWDALARHPLLADYAATQRLVTATRESARAPQTAFHRRVTDYGITNTPLARACFRARCAGLRPVGLVGALAKGGAARIAPAQLDDVLSELRELLTCHYASAPGPEGVTAPGPRQLAETDVLECQALIVWGALGETYGEQFRLHLIERLRPEGLIQRRLVKILRKARRKRSRGTLGQWVRLVVQTGLGAPSPPWYQRWPRGLRRRGEDHASRA